MFFKSSFLTAAILATSIATASAASINVPSGNYVSDAHHTNVLWNVTHFGLSNYYGRFDNVKATLQLDAKDVAKSSLSVEIDPKSVDTNFPGKPNTFNQEIAGAKFFDAAKFNVITFKSKSIHLTGAKTGTVTGDLTFHGVTKPITLQVTLNGALNPHPMSKKPAIGFSATGQIKRSDFGVNALVGPVSDEVKLVIETEFAPE